MATKPFLLITQTHLLQHQLFGSLGAENLKNTYLLSLLLQSEATPILPFIEQERVDSIFYS
jgi:hypothetical protein